MRRPGPNFGCCATGKMNKEFQNMLNMIMMMRATTTTIIIIKCMFPIAM
jgi:hypothetical protein